MVRWVVQTNLGGHYVSDLLSVCRELGYEFITYEHIPFSDALPTVDNTHPTIFYGATRWIDLIYKNNKWKPGVFFNPDSTYQVWSNEYGPLSLNNFAKVTTLIKLSQQNRDPDELIFVRPCDDQKAFAGDLFRFCDIQKWGQKLFSDHADLGNLPIIAGEAYNITTEWRLFIADGAVVTGSQYRRSRRLNINPYIPTEVMQFAEEAAKLYSPTRFFVLDVAECGGKLYVLEIGCFNSAGFYAACIKTIILEASMIAEELYNNGKV